MLYNLLYYCPFLHIKKKSTYYLLCPCIPQVIWFHRVKTWSSPSCPVGHLVIPLKTGQNANFGLWIYANEAAFIFLSKLACLFSWIKIYISISKKCFCQLKWRPFFAVLHYSLFEANNPFCVFLFVLSVCSLLPCFNEIMCPNNILLGIVGSTMDLPFWRNCLHMYCIPLLSFSVVSGQPVVKVLSPEDGKHSIVEAARRLCRTVEQKEKTSKDIDVPMFDALLRGEQEPCV